MPKAANTVTTASGEQENVAMMLLSDAVKAFHGKTLADCIIIAIPDTGKAKFSPSHEYVKTKASEGKDAVKAQSKATFVVAELGSSFAGVPLPYCQANGPTADLPLSIKLSVIATPPNRDAVTIDEALNRKVEVVPESELELVKLAVTKAA